MASMTIKHNDIVYPDDSCLGCANVKDVLFQASLRQ